VAAVVDPDARRVTHLVVRDRRFAGVERLLPISDVKAVDGASARLSRSRAGLRSLGRFTQTICVDQADPQVLHRALSRAHDGHIRWAQARPGLGVLEFGYMMVPVERELVAGREMVLHRGARVIRSDGRADRIAALEADPRNGRLTHVVVREGHFWARRGRAVPVSEIKSITDDRVVMRRALPAAACSPGQSLGRRA